MNRQIPIFFLLLVLITPPLFVHAEIPRFLRIGLAPGYAPMESKNAQGELTGFDIDLTNEICRRIQTKCIYIERDFNDLIPALKSRQIDAIVSALSITKQRRQEIAFSEKLYASDARLIALRGSSAMPDISVLKGKKIGLVRGSTEQIYADLYWRSYGIAIIPYVNQDQVYQDLLCGRLDAAFQDEVTAHAGFLDQPLGKPFAFAGPAVREREIFGMGTAVGLPKNNHGLKKAIDDAIASMRQDGTYDKLARKYFH